MTDWNVQGRFQGRTDVPLNQEGVSQAHTTARRLENIPFHHIVSSPLVRAARTAEIIATALSKPISIDCDLIECDFGSLEGKSIANAMAEHRITERRSLASILPSDAEPWGSVSERSMCCIRKWLERHPKMIILFVSHDAVMQSISEALCQSWFDNRHCTPFKFAQTGERWTLEELQT